jgi:predicted nucleic acid-binding protein
MIDLALYEMGNVLLRSLGWQGSTVADQLDDLMVVCGTPLTMTPAWLRRAAEIGATHGLTFYDAAWAASAIELDVALVSSDRILLAEELAESPTTTTRRLRLPIGT